MNVPPKVEPREISVRNARSGSPKGREAVSLLSHDLRSLLFDVTGGLSLLDLESLSDADRAQLGRVEAAANSLRLMLEQMLDRIDALPAGDGSAQSFDLPGFLDALAARWAGRAASTGADFGIDADPDLPEAIGLDRIALDRILANLIGNALKFDPDGAICLGVRKRDNDDLVFSVSDCGPGFSTAAMTSLYEFHGRPVGGDRPGSGLGLHIAQRQATDIGGTLSAHNAPDGGAVVELILPRAAWNDGVTGAQSQLDEAAIPDLAGTRILLAEDNATNQLVAGQMLRSMGCEVTIAGDGLEAMKALEEAEFDAALLDIEMPRMSGLEVLATIRASDGPNAATPLIALTAYVMREHRDRIAQAGAVDIVAKPITSVARLGRTIQAHLRGANVDPGAQQEPYAGCTADRAVMDQLLAAVGPGRKVELLARLDDDLAAIAAGLRQADETGSMEDRRAHSHVLISVAGMTGAGGLQSLARDLNAAANKNDVSEARNLSARCARSVRYLRDSLTAVADA